VNSSHSNQAENQVIGQLAYYSSHGPIETLSPSSLIDFVLIVIHGANRNADDYFCAATAAVELQKSLYGYQNVLVVAPHFLGSSDSIDKGRQQPKQENDEPSFLFWKDEGAGPWRYGADAMGPTHISSYTALDTLVATILQALGPNDKTRITMAGHSSGGQMMQRWSLLTSTWDASRMRAVVANPSSFAYLTSLRYLNGTWQQPLLGSDGDNKNCTQYNQWEWGLDPGGLLEVPYRRNVASNVSTLIGRLQHRSMTYLAGSVDRCNVSDEKGGWCHSHGLEMSCMDMLQGANRWERSARYYASLRLLGVWRHHHRQVVKGVGHDHSLMFQSPGGLQALFGGERNHDASSVSSYSSEQWCSPYNTGKYCFLDSYAFDSGFSHKDEENWSTVSHCQFSNTKHDQNTTFNFKEVKQNIGMKISFVDTSIINHNKFSQRWRQLQTRRKSIEEEF
jgi:pimeloyl-ACP methyl ester carboxylesterase